MVVVSGLVVMLVGCGGQESGDRRFANQPLPTDELSPPTVPATTRRPASVSASPVPAARLIRTVSASPRIVSVRGSTLLVTEMSTGSTTVAIDVAPQTILVASARPDGNAAALVTRDTEGHVSLARVDLTTGSTTTLLGSVVATPVPNATEPAALAWSPTSDRVFIGGSFGVWMIDPAAAPVQILAAGQPGEVTSLAVSPDGSAIAFSWDDTARSVLSVAGIGTLPVDPAEIVSIPIERRQRIAAVRWPSGAAGIVYALSPIASTDPLSGDLFMVPPAGGKSLVLASASVAAPISVIGQFAVSGDGTAIAYTVEESREGVPAFSSLWVQQIGGPTVARVVTPDGQAVVDLQWTNIGLVWVLADARSDPSVTSRTFMAMGDDGQIRVVATVDVPAATPAASPPAATRVASPVASPAMSSPATTGGSPTAG